MDGELLQITMLVDDAEMARAWLASIRENLSDNSERVARAEELTRIIAAFDAAFDYRRGVRSR